MGRAKQSIAELAIWGGPPAFSRKLHVGSPNIGDRERLFQRFNDLLDRRWLTNNGLFVQEFERQIAGLIGVKHCVAVCNGTVALEIAIRALGLHGEVIVPSFTFVATAHALQWQEITPVFCDIDPQTYLLDPDRLEALITPRTTGIIGVHLWGRACDADRLTAIAKRRQLKILFDAAHAFLCTYKGRWIGGLGDAEEFSFHATKVVNAFEGGAVVTNDDTLADKMRLMRNFGFSGYDQVIYVGTNGKMNEASAAMGITSLESSGEFIRVNRRNYFQYQKEMDGIPGISLVGYDAREKNNYQYVVLMVEEAVAGISRDDVVAILHAENVMARRYFWPGCHRMEPYRSCFPHAGAILPVTERVAERCICLPTGSAVDEAAITRICQVIRFAVENGSSIRARLQKTGHE